jgi:lipoprotein-anchoring transpeptidase ErfK/SrfK
MKTIAAILTAATLFFGAASESQASFSFFNLFGPRIEVIATVSVKQQQMFLQVNENGHTKTALIWKVSTGKPGLETPQGSFRPTWLDANHKSDEYEEAPMPYAVFFSGGYAVHATEFTKRLGTPASHGCVRLSLDNAQTFFNLVKTYGATNTKIVITE